MVNVTLENAAREMAASLTAIAKKNGVSLKGMTVDNFNEFLDSAFGDGGEVRCEGFCDLAWPYAAQFGELADAEFEEARWEATVLALEIVAREWEDGDVEKDPSRGPGDL